jgi:hypothetical protein
MLESLITDTVTDVAECVPRKFARVYKDINIRGRTRQVLEKIFAVLYIQLTGSQFESLQLVLN